MWGGCEQGCVAGYKEGGGVKGLRAGRKKCSLIGPHCHENKTQLKKKSQRLMLCIWYVYIE